MTGIPVYKKLKSIFKQNLKLYSMNNKNMWTIKNNSLSLRVKSNNSKILAIQTELNLYL